MTWWWLSFYLWKICSWHWSWKIRAELRSFILYRLWAWNRSFFCLGDSCLDLSVNHLQPLLVFTAIDGLAFLGVVVVLLCFIFSLYFFFFILFRSLFLSTFLGWFCTVSMWLLWSIVIWKEGKRIANNRVREIIKRLGKKYNKIIIKNKINFFLIIVKFYKNKK